MSPIISWKDKRCQDYINQWNNSFIIKSLNKISSICNSIIESNLFLSGKFFKFKHQMASIKLNWYLKENQELQKYKEIYFGTIDTWLIWYFSKAKYHITDASNASSTGIYHPDTKNWYKPLIYLLNLNHLIFPRIIKTFCNDENIELQINGISLKLISLCADQQASAYGSLCFEKNDVKVTLGTGLFVDCNSSTSVVHSGLL